MVLGFDGKRAAQNRTGLGNYSRFVMKGLSRFTDVEQLKVYVPNPHKTSALEGLEQERGVELHSPQQGCWKRLRSLWRVWGVTCELAKDRVQLFHGLSNELPLNIRRAKGVKSVVTIHDLIFLRYPQYYKPIDRWIYRYKFRRACEQADRVIAVSECTKRDIMHFFGTPADKIEVVYQGCDDRFRQPASADILNKVRAQYHLPDRFILYVGSIEERKNLLLLAEALEELKNRRIQDDKTTRIEASEVQVVAVGKRTPYANRVDAYLQARNLTDRFHMISGVPFSDLPAFYQLAEVFVYPSRFEGFGIPLLEALCSGTPAIGCTGSCLEEAGGPSSLYVNPDDAAALATILDRVLTDKALQSRMIADGYQWANRFQAKALTQQLMHVYTQVINSKS